MTPRPRTRILRMAFVASALVSVAGVSQGEGVRVATAHTSAGGQAVEQPGASAWAGKWIGRPTASNRPRHGMQEPSPLLRKGFVVPGRVAKAELKIAALGFYEAYINGLRVGEQVLDPAPSQFDRTAYSRTFDVTGLLESGKNAIGVELGRSYFASPEPPAVFDLGDTLFGLSKAKWWQEPRLLAQLEIHMTDGRKVLVTSDGSWTLADGPRRDALYYGEIFDARAVLNGWTLASFDDSAWDKAPEHPAPTARVIPAAMPPVKVQQTLKPVASRQLDAQTTLYDFGRPVGGWARISLTGVAGTTVILRYGEQLDPAGRVVDSILGDHVDVYTLAGGEPEVWEPSFTRHGFQYVQVETPVPVTGLRVEARLAHTALRTRGHFATSNPLLNKIHTNQLNSLRDNLYGIPTDTPFRDRQGWTADAYLFFRGAALNLDVSSLYDRWLVTLRDSQKADGGLPPIAPNSGATLLDGYSSDPSWGGTYLLNVWEHYLQFGKKSILRDNYPAMVKFLQFQEATIKNTGYIFEGTSFGDWASPGAENNLPPGQLNAPEGPMLTATGDLYAEVRAAERVARELGRRADAERYSVLAGRIGSAFNHRFFDLQSNTYSTDEDAGYRQTSNVLPLAYGLVPPGREDEVLANLVADIRQRGTDLNTGSIGTKLLLPTLTRFGQGQLAYELATQTDYPSWGNWVLQGAGTSWETWAVTTPVLSKNHPFLGTAEDWFYNHLAGIQPRSAGYGSVLIEPLFPRGLDQVEAFVNTPHGKVSSSWRRVGKDVVVLRVEVPRGVQAVVRIPKANGKHETHRVVGGVHTFRA